MKTRLAAAMLPLLLVACRGSRAITVTTPGPNFDFFGDEFTRDLAMSAASVCSACCLSHLTAEQLRAAVGTQMQFPCDARDPDCYSNCADWTVTALGVAPGKP